MVDGARNVIELQNKTFLIGGSTSSLSPLIPYFSNTVLQKIDPVGNIIWKQEYTLSPTGGENISDIFEMQNGFYIVGGGLNDSTFLNNDAFLMKVDNTGHIVWKYQYGTSLNNHCYSVQKCSDNGFILAGDTDYSLNNTIRGNLIRVDSTGVQMWNKEYIVPTGYCEFKDVSELHDKGFLAVGSRNTVGGQGTSYLVRTDYNGDTIWTRTFTTSPGNAIHSMCLTGDSGAVLVGGIDYSFGSSGARVIRIDSIGNTVWDHTLYDPTNSSWFVDVCVSETGDIYCVGNIYDTTMIIPRPVARIVKFDPYGNTIWTNNFKYHPECDHYPLAMNMASDGFVVVAGYTITTCTPTKNDCWIFKVDSTGCNIPACSVPQVIMENYHSIQWKLYPNPADKKVTVKFNQNIQSDLTIVLSDHLSRVIFNKTISMNDNHVELNTDGLAEGLYHCHLWDKNGNFGSMKLIIIH